MAGCHAVETCTSAPQRSLLRAVDGTRAGAVGTVGAPLATSRSGVSDAFRALQALAAAEAPPRRRYVFRIAMGYAHGASVGAGETILLSMRLRLAPTLALDLP